MATPQILVAFLAYATAACGAVSRDDPRDDASVIEVVQLVNGADVSGGTAADPCYLTSWAAFSFTAQESFLPDVLELYTDGGEAAILMDADGAPGDPMWVGTVSATPTPQWLPIPLSLTRPFTIGQRYWLAQTRGTCSTSIKGDLLDYSITDNLAGPWEGPYRRWRWVARLHGRKM